MSIKAEVPDARRREMGTGFVLVVALSALAGMADAIGFIATGNFISFMSGNTTRMTIAAGRVELSHALTIAALLVTFVLGNASGVVVAYRTGERVWAVIAYSTLTLALAVIVSPFSQLAMLLLTVLSMGGLNAAVERVAGIPVSLTFVTGALSRFGKGLGRLACGEKDLRFTVHILPWIGMVCGAIAGTLLQVYAETVALAFAAGFAALLTLATFWLPLSWQAAFLGLRS